MAVITLPSIFLRVRHLDVDVPGQTNRSDWTSTAQRIGQPGAPLWFAKAAFLNVSREREKRLLRGFLLAMKGQLNTFHLPVAPRQHAGPNPNVAAIVSENSITLSSAAGLSTGMFATFITGSTKRLVGLTVDPSGATITFEPELRSNPGIGSTVEIMNPYAEMSLSNPRNGWDEEEGVMTLEFDAEET